MGELEGGAHVASREYLGIAGLQPAVDLHALRIELHAGSLQSQSLRIGRPSDTNEDFIDYLRKDIRDSRFIAVHGSAADVEEIVRAHGFEQADYVLSGLPFSTLPAGVGPAIAAATHRVLRPGGAFLVYQFRARARDFLAAHFKRIDNAFEWVNVPPCFLFWGWKDEPADA